MAVVVVAAVVVVVAVVGVVDVVDVVVVAASVSFGFEAPSLKTTQIYGHHFYLFLTLMAHKCSNVEMFCRCRRSFCPSQPINVDAISSPCYKHLK